MSAPDPPPASTGPAAEAPVVVELRGITKTFPGVRANDRIDLTLRRGEVHCLLGENGAGKSTLMNVLAGIYRPEEGRVRIDGDEVVMACPRDAVARGIGMVHQQGNLVPTFTVLENLMLVQGEGLRLSEKKALEGLRGLSATLGVDVDARTEVGQLALGQRQQVEIIKALWRGSHVLILDEPTSMLTPQGINELERALVELKRRGLAIVFITHKLHEAFSVGDCITVLRRGRVAGHIPAAVMRRKTRDELQALVVELMFPGEAESLSHVAELRSETGSDGARRRTFGEALLELIDVTVSGKRGEVGITAGLTLDVRAGEVVGVAGVDGNGQRPLAEAIAGQRPLAGGDVRLVGTSVRKLSVAGRQRLGLRYVTDDRLGEGVVSQLSVALNLVSKRIGTAPFWTHGRIREGRIEDSARRLVDEFNIMTPDVRTHAGALSGGNLQKLVLARELSFAPKVVVFNKPTYGLDVKTTAAVRGRIRTLVDGGQAAALVISTDLGELLELCDRVAVLSRGRLMGVVDNAPGAEREIGALIIGEAASG